MRKLTNKTTAVWLLILAMIFTGFGSASAASFDPAAEEYAVTAEMLDSKHPDYDEGAVDLIGQQIFRFVELGGNVSTLSSEQASAMEGYYDRYESSPFFALSNLWILLCAFLVFIMHLGFATLESGLTQKKNTVNILFKNVFIICSGLLLYAVYGFNAMYPGDFNGFFALGSAITNADYGSTDISYGGTGLCQTGFADFIFQAMFAATAATIVSGAVAERVKLSAFMIFAVLLVGFAYPITGSWKWGGGWLDQKGFHDFAGSSVVHGFGGFAALAAVILLGARKGKFGPGGVKPILGHSMPLATIGGILLWFGWFGFNGGSVLSADPSAISYVIVTTSLGAATGGLIAITISWLVLKKPDLSMALNGVLAGLVGITAGADQFTLIGAVAAGGVGGALVVFSVLFFDKVKIDDPVGAISVHGVVGMWGTIAVGLGFLTKADCEATLGVQMIGTLAIGLFAFLFTFIVFGALKAVMGIRVSEEEEYEGLDVAEHGVPAYAE